VAIETEVLEAAQDLRSATPRLEDPLPRAQREAVEQMAR
jgi:hypothetical protein